MFPPTGEEGEEGADLTSNFEVDTALVAVFSAGRVNAEWNRS